MMKKILSTIPQLSALCVIALISITAISQVKAADSSDDWREEYAYNIGVAAMFYAYPYLRMAEVRYRWTMADVPYPETQPNHALNTFWHATHLIDTTWKEGGLTIVLQNKRPTDPGVNWLPAPEGPFWLVLRAYQPAQSLQEGSWRPPAVTLIQ